MRYSTWMRSAWGGFTLIELLVVIAVIALLAAILFPVFAHAREKARQATCQSNLRQIGLALAMYTDDYDETLPVSESGVPSFLLPDSRPSVLRPLVPYVKTTSIYACPSAGKLVWEGAPDPVKGDTSYAGNGAAFADFAHPLAAISAPASIVSVQEAETRTNAWFLCPDSAPWLCNGCFRIWHVYFLEKERLSNVHQEGGELLYFDWHVKWKAYRSLRSRDFGLTPDEPWSKTNTETPDSGGYYVASL